MRAQEDGVLVRRIARVEIAEGPVHDRDPVDSIGERAADELDPERRMPAGALAEMEEVQTVDPYARTFTPGMLRSSEMIDGSRVNVMSKSPCLRPASAWEGVGSSGQDWQKRMTIRSR